MSIPINLLDLISFNLPLASNDLSIGLSVGMKFVNCKKRFKVFNLAEDAAIKKFIYLFKRIKSTPSIN